MAWGDTAKAALEKAVQVYEGLAKLAAVVDQIDRRLVDFRDETRKRLGDYEQRVDNRANAIEARVDRKLDDAEARVDRKLQSLEERFRAMETRIACLEGKTEGALAEAYKLLLAKQLADNANAQPRDSGMRLTDGAANDGTLST